MLPIIFQTELFTLYSYPLLVGLAWGIAFNLGEYLLAKNRKLNRSFYYLFFGIFISSWIGAKVFYLYFSSGEKLSQHITNSNFWLGGGFVFYGGFVFGTIFYLLFTYFSKGFKREDIGFLIPSIAFCHGIGRLGCLLAGCCYGKETDFIISMHMHGSDRHPVQLYEAIGLIILGFLTFKFIQEGKKKLASITYLLIYPVLRFSLEFIRGDKLRGIHQFELSTSQWVSVTIFVCALVYLGISWRQLQKSQQDY